MTINAYRCIAPAADEARVSGDNQHRITFTLRLIGEQS